MLMCIFCTKEKSGLFTTVIYIIQVEFMIDNIFSGGDSELDSGKHTFPFQVSLKPALPTSFEGN